ncbi:MAG: LolA family protein [Planctomycetota bacterium]|jgi:outer membrane lipoprotein-sorting protein
MIRRALTLLALALLGTSGAAAQAPQDDFEALLRRLDERSATVTNLVAAFRQEKHTALLRRPLVSTGRVRVLPPLIRWDTERPFPSNMLVAADSVRIFYPEQATLEIYPLDDRLGRMATSPLLRIDPLREHFDLAAGTAPDDEPSTGPGVGPGVGAPLVHLLLTPTADALKKHISEVRLAVDEATATVRRAEIIDASNQRTTLHFEGIELNQDLVADDLVLKPPPGVTVVRPLQRKTGATGGSS